MPAAQLCAYQGTVTFNDVRIKGSLSVADIKEIASKTGILEALTRYPLDTPAAAVGKLPVDKLAGHYRQLFVGFDKVDQFKVTREDNTEFDAAPKIVAEVTLPDIVSGKAHCINVICPHPDGYVITGTQLVANAGTLTGVKSG
jgi:hypothetical protein